MIKLIALNDNKFGAIEIDCLSFVLDDKSFNGTVETPPDSLMYQALSLKGKVKQLFDV